MIELAALDSALRAAGVKSSVASVTPMPGGCIFGASKVTLADGLMLVVKAGGPDAERIFMEEVAGLKAIEATRTVLVPRPIIVHAIGGRTLLLMTWLGPGSASLEVWRRFGRDLAALHAVSAGDRYGFDHDNHLGPTVQPNGWMDDWVEFNRLRRIGWQIELASRSGALTIAELTALERVNDRLGELLPRRPRPSLLHGDLWSGNSLPTRAFDRGVLANRIAVIDPAVSIGDGWADIAMMQLFGGFAPECFQEYESQQPDRSGIADRLAVYTLYHLLNHVIIFGRSYAAQAMAIARRYA